MNTGAGATTMGTLVAGELARLPVGTLPPIVLRFDASSLPVCLIALKGEGMTDAELRDIGHYKVRTQVAKVQGAAVPPPFGGTYPQIMLYVDPKKTEADALSPIDAVRPFNDAHLIIPAVTVRQGHR